MSTGVYDKNTWTQLSSIPLVVRLDFINLPNLIDVDKPSFLPRVGRTTEEGEQSGWDFSPEMVWPFLVHTESEKIGEYPLNRQWGYPVNPEWADFMIEDYDKIPYKNLQEREEWINTVNKVYNLDWEHLPGERAVSGKCLSYASSYVGDWFKIKNTTPPYNFNFYISFLRGEEELGLNPRILEILYAGYEGETQKERSKEVRKESNKNKQDRRGKETRIMPAMEICPAGQMTMIMGAQYAKNLFARDGDMFTNFLRDSVTGEDMDMTLEKYAKVLSSKWEPRQIKDPVIRDFIYDIHRNPSGITDYKVLFSSNREADEQVLKNALRTHGIVLAGIIYRTFGMPLENSIHSAAIIGYKEVEGKTHFIYKEVFGEYDWDEPETERGGPSYRMMPAEEFNEAYIFID